MWRSSTRRSLAAARQPSHSSVLLGSAAAAAAAAPTAGATAARLRVVSPRSAGLASAAHAAAVARSNAACSAVVSAARLQLPSSSSRSALLAAVSVAAASKTCLLSHGRPMSTAATSTHSSAADLVAKVADMQAKLGESHAVWLGRVASAAALADAPFRITVIGDAGSGQDRIVEALLGQSATVPAADPHKITKISHGTPAVANDAAPAAPAAPESASKPVINAISSSKWLDETKSEIFSISSAEALAAHPEEIEDVLLKSDAVLLVSNPERELTGLVDQMVLRNFIAKGKQNVFVVLASDQAQSGLVGRFESKLAASLVHIKTARLLDLKLPTVLSVTRDGSDAAHVKSSLAPLVSKSAKTKTSTIQFLAWSALQHLSEHHTAVTSRVVEATDAVKAVAKHIVDNEQRLVNQFRESDLGSVQTGIVALTDSIKSYFARTPFWKLFWRSDFIADDLHMRMREHTLVKAEYQMTYATGKANEALVQLTQHLISTLKPFTLPTHQFSQHAVTAALQTDIARLLQIAESNSPPNGPAIDPFLLRNEVAAFDETKLCDNVQKQAERIVQRQLVTQLAVYASAVLATHLGVPFAISLPSAILASGLGFSWMNLRWSSAQRRYLGRIGESQKVLKDTLTTAYDNEFARVVAAPLAVSVKMISEAIQQRAQDAANANKAIEDLAQTIKREIEQRGDSA